MNNNDHWSQRFISSVKDKWKNLEGKRISLNDWFVFGLILTLTPLLIEVLRNWGTNHSIIEGSSTNGQLLLLCTGLTGGPITKAFRCKNASSRRNVLFFANSAIAFGSIMAFAAFTPEIENLEHIPSNVMLVSWALLSTAIVAGSITMWDLE